MRALTVFFLAFLIIYSCSDSEDRVHIYPNELHPKMKEKPGTLLDVRTAREHQRGHIEGSINVDFHAETFQDELLKLDLSKPVYVYCASGGRSTKTVKLLNDLGHKDAYNLVGGFTNWSKRNMPIKNYGSVFMIENTGLSNALF